MVGKIVGILDREVGYTRRLTEVFNSRNRMGFHAEAFTGVEAFMEYSRKNTVEILLIGESLIDNTLKNTAKMILIISEGGKIAEQEEYQIVYKYQSSELVIKKVIEYYAREGKHAETYVRSKAKIYGVYAPQERRRKSAFAWNLAKWLGKEQSVLYIGLNVFGEIKELYNSDKDLADIMYYVGHGFDNLIYLVGSSVTVVEEIDCLPAMKSVDDLIHVPAGDWLKLLQVIGNQGNYGAVVVDMEECVQQFYKIMEYCYEVYLPYYQQGRNSMKWELCQDYFKRVGAEEIWKKAKHLKMDSNCWNVDMETILCK